MTDWADDIAYTLWEEDIAWRVFQGGEDDGDDLRRIIAKELRVAFENGKKEAKP